ncbi:MAG: circularly permuted type 2 ATP-grasp protein [Planctomycetota bacterium]
MKLDTYETRGFYDELLTDTGVPRMSAVPLMERLAQLEDGEIQQRQHAAERALFEAGTTFNVYHEDQATERIIPFDVVPRILDADVWDSVQRGLVQRIVALNHFLTDVYGPQKILKDKVVPAEFVELDDPVFKCCAGLQPPRGVWCHISGIDLVRTDDRSFHVLEDNLRCPSGVSYVLENRRVLKQTFPRVFGSLPIRAVDDYPERLLATLDHLAPPGVDRPRTVVLTPGIYNSAYFEHSYLAQQMGVPLVEGSDLVVHDGFVKMKTTRGLQRVDTIYRRIDDAFLDPACFRPDSALGVPGLMEVYRAGRVALANAPGAGIADSKVIYTFVPDMIRYYLREDPILPNVETFLCARDADRQHVLANLDKLVVKPANEAGGKGILVGPHATRGQRDAMAEQIKADPTNFIGQPTLSLSRCPTVIGDELQGRHVDLRPYILYGQDVYVLPGGLTRVALREGSLVVNSSQGGGTKDTWVLDRQPPTPPGSLNPPPPTPSQSQNGHSGPR